MWKRKRTNPVEVEPAQFVERLKMRLEGRSNEER